MKSFIVKILTLLCLASLFILGLDWVLSTGGWVNWLVDEQATWEGLRALPDPWLVQAIGVAFMALPVLALFAWFLLGRDENIRAKSKTGSAINLPPRAVEKVVAKRVRTRVRDVVRVQAIAEQGGGSRVKVTVNVAVTGDVPVPDVSRRVREETALVMNHLFGLKDTNKIRVVVYDVTGRKVSNRRRKRRPAGSGRPRSLENRGDKLVTSGKTE